jgi:N-hydroxyarylamine O-acetyltransferase
MDEQALTDYLARIGMSRPRVVDAAVLAGLHRAHLMTVPFENLSIHLAEEISLAEEDLVAKLVARRRGGFCYELNGGFALLLEGLGARVTRVAARVYGENGALGPPFDHLALLVRTADGSGPWLVDVGFGSHSTFPLLFGSRDLQRDPAGTFLLADARADGEGDGGTGDVDVLKDGEPAYRVEPRPRDLADFVPTCWWQQTSPTSHFTKSLVCSRLTETGRMTLSGQTLIRTIAGERTGQDLPSDAAVLAAYRDYFGITLDRIPRVRSPLHANL